ncbi:MAG: signal recognition particle-docking protein FtsY [Candidatus Nanopelagicales bacterium]|nr:signal recognition particle-docking protein FtsY [Candidatus Nanopelagicales bacterium]MCH9679505.1 signal recognition particle-docking protein FtsY [Actinomycetes bacterium]MCH1404483.1 signal recognition particle-docking protein FtsY [Candidatus Nanopelagicales bacterium]MCH1462253.1 signal recognition particle-docking protein FtsY [Candidatus Nanopelagicales bacterium]MCH9707745.1 signal recognition particle-docking protein FtsY [Actinomycetes bacterium]
MESLTWYVVIAVVLLGFVIGAGIALMRGRGSTTSAPAKPRPGIDYAPGVGDDDSVPRDTPRRSVTDVAASVLDEPQTEPDSADATWEVEDPEPTKGRLHRLRERLARSNNALGKNLLSLLARDDVDEDTWEQVEEILLTADLGVAATNELMERLRSRIQVAGARDAESVRSLLRDELLVLVDPTMDRTVKTKADGRPAVILVVGVNGTGKTTTSGKLARVLVADGRTVLLGAADTFRAAAAEQLQTWGDRVGAVVVRGPEGGDPASVAFEAVDVASSAGLDAVVVDTAGRLHTKTGLMDELGKVKRVVEKNSQVDEVLLVLDATTGQNGLVQARVFADVVDVTGIALTKLDGTAKGGIVVSVQRELGVPVKLVGLGEGPDDLAPFEAEEFVDALLA